MLDANSIPVVAYKVPCRIDSPTTAGVAHHGATCYSYLPTYIGGYVSVQAILACCIDVSNSASSYDR